MAGRLAGAGLDVVGIESALVGGECPYWGCVPSKMIIRAANALAEARRADQLAGHATVQPDWAVVARRIREEATDDWDDTVAVKRFTGKGGRFVRGRATVTGSRTVVAGGQEFRASRGLVLATGTQPAVPPIEGLAGTPYWTNHEALETKEAPASLTVAGGGAIGTRESSQRARKYRSARLQRTAPKGRFQYRTAGVCAFSLTSRITQRDAGTGCGRSGRHGAGELNRSRPAVP